MAIRIGQCNFLELSMNKLTVVMYHYVRDLKNSRFPEIKGLDLALFNEQIEYLKKNYNFISIQEVIDSVENCSNIPEKSVLLTFDDAYSDHYTNVFPVLDKHKIKGCFYTPAKAIVENTVLDVNKIHFVLASVDDKSLILNDLKILLKKYKEQYKLYDFSYYFRKLAQDDPYDSKEVVFIKRLLQVDLPEELRMKMVDYLFEKYTGMSEQSFSKELYMSEAQLQHMISQGHHIGNHGYNHYWWNSLSEKDMKKELESSMAFLQRIGVDMNNWTACYPYGSYDDQSIKMLEEMGCKLAFTTEPGIARTIRSTRFVMPRIDTNELPKDKRADPNIWYHKG